MSRFGSILKLVNEVVQTNTTVRIGYEQVSRPNIIEMMNLNEAVELLLAGAPADEIGMAFQYAYEQASGNVAQMIVDEEAAV